MQQGNVEMQAWGSIALYTPTVPLPLSMVQLYGMGNTGDNFSKGE